MKLERILILISTLLPILVLPPAADAAPPVNDSCLDALPIGPGRTTGSTSRAHADFPTCSGRNGPDVWYRYTGPIDEEMYLEILDSSFDAVLSLHDTCTLPTSGCDSITGGTTRITDFDDIYIRVSGTSDTEEGSYTLQIGRGARMSGRVIDEDGVPLGDVRVSVSNGSAITDSEGRYAISSLSPGTHYVRTSNELGLLDEMYPDVPCGPCDRADATPVTLQMNASVTGIDFVLGPGGTISGTVVDIDTGLPIADAVVSALETAALESSPSATTSSDVEGRFRLEALAGSFQVKAEIEGYRGQFYSGLDCEQRSCSESRELAELVEVEIGQDTGGIDFHLDQKSVITGRVVQTIDGAPVSGLPVLIKNQVYRTDEEGVYRASVLDPGSYEVLTASARYLNEVYPGVVCPLPDPILPTPCPGGELIELGDNETVSGIDFSLDRLGIISGTITDAASGAPLAGVRVPATEYTQGAGSPVYPTFSDENGHYRLESAPPGPDLNPAGFPVSTSNFSAWVDEAYDDIVCEYGCNFEDLDLIEVGLNSVHEGIDFALDRGGEIRGRVRTSDGLGGWVQIFGADGRVLYEEGSSEGGFSDEQGFYRVIGLPAGTYYARASSHGYASQIYRGRDGRLDLTEGTPIRVQLGQVVDGIDFDLAGPGGLFGTVRDAFGDHPVRGVEVRAHHVEGHYRTTRTLTDSKGRFIWRDILPGDYVVEVPASRFHLGQIYDGVTCGEEDCRPEDGVPVSVRSTELTRGVDFALERRDDRACLPDDDNTLCLNQGRFKVVASWTLDGVTYRSARAVQLTEDSGYFWFFNSDNVELVAKLLDGCSQPSNHYWFFAGGLTDVGTRITVIDTVTDENRIYDKPAGQVFESILDTRALDVCGSEIQLPAVPSTSIAEPDSNRGTSSNGLPLALAATDVPFTPTGSCVPDSRTLCLNQGRFKVAAGWETATGEGLGQAVHLTADSGYFWFFNADNVEVVIKILNGCAEPQNTYWVFAAGLTNVEVSLKVTDTRTGEVREYFNPQGQVYEPILDTRAFSTCP